MVPFLHGRQGKAKYNPHRRTKTQRDESISVPRLEADFCIVDTDRTALTIIDTTTSYVQVVLLPLGKTSADSYAVRSFTAFLRCLPYVRFILQVDQEPALIGMAAHYGSLPALDDLLGARALRRAAWTLNRVQPTSRAT